MQKKSAENIKENVVDVIRDILEAKLIRTVDPMTAPRYLKYVPIWA